MHDAENGVIDISECEWPAYLYPLDRSPDIDDDLEGLFRGYLIPMVCYILSSLLQLILLQVLRQILTGPRSALDPVVGKKGRSSKAQLHNLTSITGRTIAYACVVVSIFRVFNYHRSTH